MGIGDTHLYMVAQGIKETIEKRYGEENGFSFIPLTDAGSSRMFYRLSSFGENKAILIVWDANDGDWDYFIALNKIKALHGIIPSHIELRRKENWALVRDCGEKTLKSLFYEHVNDIKKQESLLNEVAKKLAFWQNTQVPERNIISKRIFSMKDLLWETDYFREHISFLFPDTKKLFFCSEFDMERNELALIIDSLPKCLMHRDFQSENITFADDMTASFVDIQGVRIGPTGYDVASLLFDPYLYPMIGETLRFYFIEKLLAYGGKLDSLFPCALQRLMQAMGAYANLSTNKDKQRYRQYIKPAVLQALEITNITGRFVVISAIMNIIAKQIYIEEEKL